MTFSHFPAKSPLGKEKMFIHASFGESICVVERTTPFGHSITARTNELPLQDSSFIRPLIIRHTRNADCHFVSERVINRAHFTPHPLSFEIVVFVWESLLWTFCSEASLVK
ncbi:hypothetical protein CEXT_568501 [Caerostris extrusa]|uniref:Uncharacterized protein n=1 Tax=Caerostris extrusa TaxID=172846 RepID=A0AAV4YCM6_CAEEX|nr:hypothetical protein CEXT_568501 [Caerostris extrusa]